MKVFLSLFSHFLQSSFYFRLALFVKIALIDKSGMVYSEQWVNGNIQGNMIGKVPHELLLLCLVSSRFIKASEQLLQGTARDLQVFDTVKAALQRWDLEDSYPNVSDFP